jgi:hypothetical protein
MSEKEIVYKAIPDKVLEIVQLLENHRLHPEVIDDTGKTGSYRSDYVRIAVPLDERDTALSILADIEQKNENNISILLKSTNKIILIIIALLAIVAIIGILDQGGKWFIITWLLLTIFTGAALIRWAWYNKSKN